MAKELWGKEMIEKLKSGKRAMTSAIQTAGCHRSFYCHCSFVALVMGSLFCQTPHLEPLLCRALP
jgi:hypothetical protein